MADTTDAPPFDITPVAIEEEMKRSYLDYAMSVIVSRAIPDVRDGLKPVHRRILFAMQEAGYDWNRPHRKSARVVGDVMGKYHPHGDAAIYDTMVRMAQDFSMRLPLIDGQGNFGSMDGDPAAAMRYTEVRLARAAHEMLDDIDKETVEFQSNYDESAREPMVLPARLPNLLVNGAGGIAVGMATNIPPHNLGEVLDACCALLDDPELSINALMELIPAPDFPTGGIIIGRAGVRAAYHTGRGSVMMRGRTHVEDVRKDRPAVIVTEVPYQVNKARMVERIAEVVRDKRVEGISDLRDESDRDGVRVVIELQRGADPAVVLNQLYQHTPLQTRFGVNLLALHESKPQLMNLKSVLVAFVDFRREVITKRTVHELGKARERAHILVGLAIAVANIDPVIELIRSSPDPTEARARLIARVWPAADVAPLIKLIDEPGRAVEDGAYRMSEAQARAILELRLQRLTGLERSKIADELAELARRIAEYLAVLGSPTKVGEIMRGEFLALKEQFANPRRTTIEDREFETDIEDLIQHEEMVVTVSHGSYVKRVPLSTYRAQRRGGKGRSGMATKEEDFVSQVFVCDTHTPMLFFSSRGMVYKLKVYRLPQGTPTSRGKALVNLLPLVDGETVTTAMALPTDESAWDRLNILLATASGSVRRNNLSDFTHVLSGGKIAMKLDEGDRLIGVATCSDDNDVLLATRKGKGIRFSVTNLRVFSGRTSTGVRGIRIATGDEVISMSILRHFEATLADRDAYLQGVNAKRRLDSAEPDARPEDRARDEERARRLNEPRFKDMAINEEYILSVATDGLGMRISSYDFPVKGRGGQGVVNLDLTRQEGPDAEAAAAFPVAVDDQIVMMTDGGKLIRCPVDDVRVARRHTRGVRLLDVAAGETVTSVARLAEEAGADEASEKDGDAMPAQ